MIAPISVISGKTRRHRSRLQFIKLCGSVLVLAVLLATPLFGQDDGSTILDHSEASRIWLAGQINVIQQQHPSFFAKYTGENSIKPERQKATSRVLTLYTGAQLSHSTEILFDVESAGGQGISDALGLSGFANLDVVRNPTLGSKPYLARLLFHATWNLGGERAHVDRTFLSLASEKSERRLEIYAGKM